MRIIYYDHQLWRYYLSRVPDEVTTIPIEEPTGRWHPRLLTLFSYYGYDKKFAQKFYTQNFTSYSGLTLVVDCHNPTVLKRIADSQLDKSLLFVWFWNPLRVVMRHYDITKTLRNIKRLGYSIYTFDKREAAQYGLTFKNQFGIIFNHTYPLEYDLYFCGNSKGREKQISYVTEKCQEEGLKTKTIIPSTNNNFISYEENIRNALSSRCLLDIVQSGQTGLSLRVIEAILNNKKLITSNKDVRKYDFYHPDNILILDEQKLLNIRKFIYREFRVIPDEIKKKYTFENWIKDWLKLEQGDEQHKHHITGVQWHENYK